MKKSANAWKVCLVLVAAFILLLKQGTVTAAESEKAIEKGGKAATPASRFNDKVPYLGVFIEDLHPALASHLPGIGPSGQGLLVQAVTVNSPAAKAGIQEHDILLAYDDQKRNERYHLLRSLDMSDRDNPWELLPEENNSSF